jgi:hypothetical protein
MIRSTFNVASTLSLALGCAIAAAWAWGQSTPRAFEFGYKGALWQVVSHGGRLRIDNLPQLRLERAPAVWIGRRFERLHEAEVRWGADHDTLAHLRLNHFSARVQSTIRTRFQSWSTPLFQLLGVTALLPTLRLSAWGFAIAHRRSRRKAGQCEECGYDLRASPGTCPECGDTPRPLPAVKRENTSPLEST